MVIDLLPLIIKQLQEHNNKHQHKVPNKNNKLILLKIQSYKIILKKKIKLNLIINLKNNSILNNNNNNKLSHNHNINNNNNRNHIPLVKKV